MRAPLDRWSSRRFLPVARRQAWADVLYAARLSELDVLTSAQVGELLQPGPVLLRLAVRGVGVRLPSP